MRIFDNVEPYSDFVYKFKWQVMITIGPYAALPNIQLPGIL